MMTRREWLELRRRQGHRIFLCECGHMEPEYNAWYHEFNTGHDMNAYIGSEIPELPGFFEIKVIDKDLPNGISQTSSSA